MDNNISPEGIDNARVRSHLKASRRGLKRCHRPTGQTKQGSDGASGNIDIDTLKIEEDGNNSNGNNVLDEKDDYVPGIIDNLILEIPDDTDDTDDTYGTDNTNDERISSCWKKFIKKLSGNVIKLQNELYSQQIVNKKNTAEIKSLTETVSQLSAELEAGKHWQNIVYNELQKVNSHNEKYAEKLAEMYTYFQKQSNSVNDIIENNSEQKEKKKKKNTTKVSRPVIYGDSIASTKLSSRKRLKVTFKEEKVATEEDVLLVQDQDMVVDNTYATTEEVVYDKSKSSLDTSEINNLALKNTTAKKCIEEMPKDTVESVVRPDKDTNTEKSVEDVFKEASDYVIQSSKDATTEKSIEETLREAAESVVQTSGFVYDEVSGLYYDWNSKMYYNPSTQLYYDHDNGIYYYFDAERNSYLFHSQIEVPEYVDNQNLNIDQEMSDGEVCSDDSDANVIDPCIRIIVVQSESIDVGSLFIVTCKGGTIGREQNNLIIIPEEMVSKSHAYILYDETEKTFFIQDKKTPNGTFINNERIADPHTTSEPIEITHRDYVKIGDTTLSLHIHLGHDTCVECEPGNIQAIIAEKEKDNESIDLADLNSQRKKELKGLRKKYGISPGYLPKSLIESIPNRAERRRKEVGSEPYQNAIKPVTKASVHQEISQENKGHKMLAKMGWKSGEGLGKTKSGITQPITVNVLQKKKGLGSGVKASLDSSGGGDRKTENWNKARERYNKLEQS